MDLTYGAIHFRECLGIYAYASHIFQFLMLCKNDPFQKNKTKKNMHLFIQFANTGHNFPEKCAQNLRFYIFLQKDVKG